LEGRAAIAPIQHALFFAASMLDQQIKISFAFYFCFVLFLQRAFCLDIFCFFNVALPQEVLAMANANSKIKTNMYCIVKEKGINLGLSKKKTRNKNSHNKQEMEALSFFGQSVSDLLPFVFCLRNPLRPARRLVRS
jgi:hypothetical protein